MVNGVKLRISQAAVVPVATPLVTVLRNPG